MRSTFSYSGQRRDAWLMVVAVAVVAAILAALVLSTGATAGETRRDKTSAGSNPGWPMNRSDAEWTAAGLPLPKSQARADSIRRAIAIFVGGHYLSLTNGDKDIVDTAKTYGLPRKFTYNSFQDNYVNPADDEHRWLVQQAVAAGRDSESVYLHYYDSTQISLQGTVLSFPGVAPTRAKTKADTVNSRVPAYYADRSRIIPDYTNPWVRTAICQYARLMMTGYDSAGGIHADYPDGIFWDNVSTSFWNAGSRIYGGHVAEVASRPRIDSFSAARLGIWSDSFIVPFFTQLKADFDTSAQWSVEGDQKVYYINTSGVQDPDYWQNDLTYGVGHEANPNPATTSAGALENLYRWDSTCAAHGIWVIYVPPPTKTVTGISGSWTHRQALLNTLTLFYMCRSDSAIYSPAYGTSVLMWGFPDTAWIGANDIPLGEPTARPTVLSTGLDGRNQSATVYQRRYDSGLAVFRTRSSSMHFDTLSAYACPLPFAVREISPNGDTGAVVTATTLRPGQGRMFVDTAAGQAPVINPFLAVSPSRIDWTVWYGGALPIPQTITVTNQGGDSLFWDVTTTSSGWLASSVPAAPGWHDTGSGNFQVYLTTSFLTPGVHQGEITVLAASPADNTPQVIPVQLTVLAARTIALAPETLNFSTVLYWPSLPATQTVAITNGGDSSFAWSATSDSAWVGISPTSGTSPALLRCSVTTTGPAAIDRWATVTIAAPTATNSPQTVSIGYSIASVPPALPDSGACCVYGACFWTDSATCAWIGGTYYADSTCSDSPCPQPPGSYRRNQRGSIGR